MNSVRMRPDEVQVDTFKLAIEQLIAVAFEGPDTIGRARLDSEVVSHVIAASAYGRVITNGLMQAQWPITADALRHSATGAQVAIGTGLGSDELRAALRALVSTEPRAGACIWCGVVWSHTDVDADDRCSASLRQVPSRSILSRPELTARGTDGVEWSEEAPGCRECGHSFSPESTPHLDRCWECAERAEVEGVL